MSNIEFEEDRIVGRAVPNKPASAGFAEKLIKWGIVKNESQAGLVMMVLIIVCFIAIGVQVKNIFFRTNPVEIYTPPPGGEKYGDWRDVYVP